MNTENIRKGLNSTESGLISDLMAEGKAIITIKDLNEKLHSPVKSRKLANNLVKKKWLEPLNKGVYLVLALEAGSKPKWTEDPFYIASKLANPYYIGFYNMINFYGWTEQIPLTIHIATAKRLKNKVILGIRFEFIFLTEKKFFGTINRSIRGHSILVSDPEKTIIDALDRPEFCGGIEEVAKALFNANKELNWKKVLEYAKKNGNGAVIKKLGFLIELMEINIPEEIIKELHSGLTEGFATLFSAIKEKNNSNKSNGKYNYKWRILINFPISKKSVLS